MHQRLKNHLQHKPLFRDGLIPFARVVRRTVQHSRQALYRSRYFTISKKEFIRDLKTAIANKAGYAAGKIGYSEQHWMYYEILLKKEKNTEKIRVFEKDLNFHSLKQEGIFPADPNFYLKFNQFYLPHVRNMDCLGICYRPWERKIIRYYALKK